jgi:hypothetical protein
MKRVFDSLAVYEDKSYLATDSAAQRPAVDTFGQKQPPAVEVNINPSTEKVLTVDTAMLNKRRKQRNLQAQ